MPTAARPLTLADAVDESLARIDRSECGPEILRTLHLEATRLLRASRPESHSSGMTPHIRAILIESQVFTTQSLVEMEERLARGELRESEDRTRLETIAASYGEHEVAERLGLDVREVQYRARIGTLYSFPVGGVTVYPKWQFAHETEDKLLPHLARVLASLLEEWDPASVQGFMSTPKEDLTSRGKRMTPVEWLLQGKSPRRVEVILEWELCH